MTTLEGPCEGWVLIERSPGCLGGRRCGQPGEERPDVSPGRAVADILCDEHYEAERVRRLQ